MQIRRQKEYVPPGVDWAACCDLFGSLNSSSCLLCRQSRQRSLHCAYPTSIAWSYLSAAVVVRAVVYKWRSSVLAVHSDWKGARIEHSWSSLSWNLCTAFLVLSHWLGTISPTVDCCLRCQCNMWSSSIPVEERVLCVRPRCELACESCITCQLPSIKSSATYVGDWLHDDIQKKW